MKFSREKRAEVVEWLRSHRLVETDKETAAHFGMSVFYVQRLRQRAGIVKGLQVQAFMREKRGRKASGVRYAHARMSDEEKLPRKLKRKGVIQHVSDEPLTEDEHKAFMRSKGYVV